jgi:CTP:molybdopterin cytidylyltransferase MocA
MQNIYGLILAAGASRRMGTPKALLEFPDGRTLLQDQVKRLQDSGLKNIVVVTGCQQDLIQKVHQNLQLNWVINENWSDGQFSSLLCGLKYICRAADKSAGVLLLPLDAVQIEPEIMRSIADKGNRAQCNIIPTYQNKPGHPVFLATQFILRLINKSDSQTQLDRELATDPLSTKDEVAAPSILNNVNTPDDWQNIIS